MKTNSRRSRLLAMLFSCGVCAGLSGMMANAVRAETLLAEGLPSVSSTVETAEAELPSVPAVPEVAETPSLPDVPGGLFGGGSGLPDLGGGSSRKSSGFDIGSIMSAIPIDEILTKNPQIIRFIEKNPQIIELMLENPQLIELMLKNVNSLPF